MEISRRLRAESSRRPPRRRRDACSIAWRTGRRTAKSLFSAVEKDDEQSVAKLLKRGVDVDLRDENEYTALLLASETGATKSSGTLIKAAVPTATRATATAGAPSTRRPSAARTRPSRNCSRPARRPGTPTATAAAPSGPPARRATPKLRRACCRPARTSTSRTTTASRRWYAVAHGNADVAEFARAHGAAEVDGGRLSRCRLPPRARRSPRRSRTRRRGAPARRREVRRAPRCSAVS